MIEGPRKRGAPFRFTPPPAFQHATESGKALAVRAWRLVVPPQRQADVFLWNLRLASRLLWVLLAGLGAYVVMDLVLRPPQPRLTRELGPPSGGSDAARPSVPALRPLSEYVTALTQRNPFTGSPAGVAEETVAAKTARRQLEELASDLTVVGIDRGPQPVALIEHKGQQRTFVVKVGDAVNGLRVTQIGPDGVRVSYEGEETFLQ